MKRLAAVGVVGVDPVMSGPVVHTDAGAAPVGKAVEKRGSPKSDGPLYPDGMSAHDGSAARGSRSASTATLP